MPFEAPERQELEILSPLVRIQQSALYSSSANGRICHRSKVYDLFEQYMIYEAPELDDLPISGRGSLPVAALTFMRVVVVGRASTFICRTIRR